MKEVNEMKKTIIMIVSHILLFIIGIGLIIWGINGLAGNQPIIGLNQKEEIVYVDR